MKAPSICRICKKPMGDHENPELLKCLDLFRKDIENSIQKILKIDTLATEVEAQNEADDILGVPV